MTVEITTNHSNDKEVKLFGTTETVEEARMVINDAIAKMATVEVNKGSWKSSATLTDGSIARFVISVW